MSWVAVAVVGAGAAVAGTQYAGASLAAGATREGAQIAGDASNRGASLQMEMFQQAQRALQPFVNIGTAAGSSLQNMVVSPQERTRQLDLQRADLQAEVSRLSQPILDSDIAPPGGKNSSERWAQMVYQARGDRDVQLREAQNKLSSFNKRAEMEIGQLDARQKEGIQATPLYEFQKDIGERNIKRYLSSVGRLDTGAGMETLSNFYRALGAEETERQSGRLMNLTTIGANAAAGQSTNAMNTGTVQSGLIANAGQLYGQGISQAGQIEGAGIQGVGKTATQVGLLALLAGNAGLFSNGGNPTDLGGTASAPGTGSLVNMRPGFGGQPSLVASTY